MVLLVPRASSRDVTMAEQRKGKAPEMRRRNLPGLGGNAEGRRGARAPWGNGPRGSRAAPGHRSRALGPAARSSLMGRGSAGRHDRRHATEPLQKRGPAPMKTPQRSAERRPRLATGAARQDGSALRRSVPSGLVSGGRNCPRESGEWKTAYPAPLKNRGDHACPHGCARLLDVTFSSQSNSGGCKPAGPAGPCSAS